jgi:hypothetical protein
VGVVDEIDEFSELYGALAWGGGESGPTATSSSSSSNYTST